MPYIGYVKCGAYFFLAHHKALFRNDLERRDSHLDLLIVTVVIVSKEDRAVLYHVYEFL